MLFRSDTSVLADEMLRYTSKPGLFRDWLTAMRVIGRWFVYALAFYGALALAWRVL